MPDKKIDSPGYTSSVEGISPSAFFPVAEKKTEKISQTAHLIFQAKAETKNQKVTPLLQGYVEETEEGAPKDLLESKQITHDNAKLTAADKDPYSKTPQKIQSSLKDKKIFTSIHTKESYTLIGKDSQSSEGVSKIFYPMRKNTKKMAVSVIIPPKAAPSPSTLSPLTENELHMAKVMMSLQTEDPEKFSKVAKLSNIDQFESGEQAIIGKVYNSGNLQDAILEKRLSLQDKLLISQDIAEGLDQLHSAHIIHRDLRLANVLLHQSKERKDGSGTTIKEMGRKTAYLNDFGLSSLTQGKDQRFFPQLNMFIIPPEWHAPYLGRLENFLQDLEKGPSDLQMQMPTTELSLFYDTQSEMGSFGILLYQLFYEKLEPNTTDGSSPLPWEHDLRNAFNTKKILSKKMTSYNQAKPKEKALIRQSLIENTKEAILLEKMIQNKKLSFAQQLQSDHVPAEITSLIQALMQSDRQKRPSAKEAYQILQRIDLKGFPSLEKEDV